MTALGSVSIPSLKTSFALFSNSSSLRFINSNSLLGLDSVWRLGTFFDAEEESRSFEGGRAG